MSKEYLSWQLKYIQFKSEIGQKYTDVELAQLLSISRQSIAVFKREHPEIKEEILKNLKKQMCDIGSLSLRALYTSLTQDKVHPKLIEMGLRINDILVDKSDNINRFDNPDAAKKHIANILASALRKDEKPI
jgi:hypothetical protein